jgi:hypothetical protein
MGIEDGKVWGNLTCSPGMVGKEMTTRNPKAQFGKIILCLTSLLWLAGCTGTVTGNWTWFKTSAVDQDFGNSVRNNYAQTVVNPGAGRDNSPTVGLEPGAAANTLSQYEKGFKGEEKKGTEMKITY